MANMRAKIRLGISLAVAVSCRSLGAFVGCICPYWCWRFVVLFCMALGTRCERRHLLGAGLQPINLLKSHWLIRSGCSPGRELRAALSSL